MSGVKRLHSAVATPTKDPTATTTTPLKRPRTTSAKPPTAPKKPPKEKLRLILDAAQSIHPSPLSVSDLTSKFPTIPAAEIVTILNTLTAKKRLNVLKSKKDNLVLWKAIPKDESRKFRSLTRDQMVVYEEIKKANNVGLSKKEIKNKTNFLTAEITKITNLLITKDLIKLVQVVPSKRKVFMLKEVEPKKDLTGGPWYNEDLEYDLQFVKVLYQEVREFIKKGGRSVGVEEVRGFVNGSGMSKVELSESDIESLLETMVFDGVLEYDGEGDDGREGGFDRYRWALPTPGVNTLIDVPCGTCPVRQDCTPGGRISPESCKYMEDWLATVNDW